VGDEPPLRYDVARADGPPLNWTVLECVWGPKFMTSVSVVDYGMGNLRSVGNAFGALGASVTVVKHPHQLRNCERVVLPGVGAFGDAMANLSRAGWPEALAEHALRRERPFLGICLGMQLLAARGTEHGQHAGLGWFSGEVRLLERPHPHRIPHMGWNDVRALNKGGLLRDLAADASCYFVHSFAFAPEDAGVVTGVTEYGGTDFVSVVERGNVVATQFHPEKSQKHGLMLLSQFLQM
jgi:imidazole glycerol-phosphate synthase subunit HisH